MNIVEANKALAELKVYSEWINREHASDIADQLKIIYGILYYEINGEKIKCV